MKFPARIVSGEHADGRPMSDVYLLSRNVRQEIARIVHLAWEEDREAVLEIHKIAASCVSVLHEMGEHSPGILRPIAPKNATWPGWLTRDADIKKRSEKVIKAIGLGEEGVLNYSGRQWTRETKETLVALQIHDTLRTQREMWENRGQHEESWRRLNRRLGRPEDYRPEKKPVLIKNLTPERRNAYEAALEGNRIMNQSSGGTAAG